MPSKFKVESLAPFQSDKLCTSRWSSHRELVRPVFPFFALARGWLHRTDGCPLREQQRRTEGGERVGVTDRPRTAYYGSAKTVIRCALPPRRLPIITLRMRETYESLQLLLTAHIHSISTKLDTINVNTRGLLEALDPGLLYYL